MTGADQRNKPKSSENRKAQLNDTEANPYQEGKEGAHDPLGDLNVMSNLF
jgi:hypothetical protein